MDILNQFIVSQELVAKVDAEVDLRAMYTKAENDPLNAFHPDGTIEDLVKYWQRMVLVNYDNGTGLMNLEVFAFDPVDARTIAEVVLVESTNIINELSKTAQEDTTRYSKEALAATEAKLAEARLAVLDFQIRNRIVDPSNMIANQLSVVSTLNQQLAGHRAREGSAHCPVEPADRSHPEPDFGGTGQGRRHGGQRLARICQADGRFRAAEGGSGFRPAGLSFGPCHP
jgi:capsule polysaccharide export protein KpsE/RkpR